MELDALHNRVPGAPAAEKGTDLRRSSFTVRIIHPDDYRPKPGSFDADPAVAPPPWKATVAELALASAFEPGALLRMVDPFLCTDGVYFVATAQSVTAVFKPAAEIDSSRPLVPLRSNHLREVAAYRLSQLLGFPDVPPTIAVVEADRGPGSLRSYVTGHVLDGRQGDPAKLMELQVFDFLIGNQDRHNENVIVSMNNAPVPIDNGLSFPIQDDRESFRLLGEHLELPLPPTSLLRNRLARVHPDSIAFLLRQCSLEEEAIAGVLARRRALLNG